MAEIDVPLDGVSVSGGKVVIGIDIGGKVLPVSALRTADNADVDASNPLPVHDASPSLPSGAATQTTLAAVLAKIIAAPSTAAGQAAILAALQSALPLPTGAATSALQGTGNTSLASILSGLSALATNAAQATAQTSLSAIVTALGSLATQTTVAAILSALQGALTVGLPSGAATAAAQGTGNASVASIDGKIVACNTGAVTVATCALPAGASTSAAQATAQTSLSSIATNTGTDAANTTAIATSTASTATNTGTIAGAVSGGRVLTTEASAASIASNTSTTASNSTTLAGGAAALGATMPANVLVEGGVGSTAAPSAVGSGKLVAAWRTLTGAAYAALLGVDGAAIASATNGVPVIPATGALYDVKDRAARLLGALTGINGSGVATGANPVPMQMSDGSAVFTAAKASQLPATLGAKTAATSLAIVAPNDTAIPSILTGPDASLVLAIGPTRVTAGSGGAAILAGAANRRIMSLVGAFNPGVTQSVLITITLGAPAGTYPNLTNVLHSFSVAAGQTAAPILYAQTGGYSLPSGTSLYAIASTVATAQTDPTTEPFINVMYAP